MDISRTRGRAPQTPKAVDGFFVKPTQSTRMAATSPRRTSEVRRAPAGVRGQRRVDDFGRRDGFYAAPRRAAAAGRPLPIAAQFELPEDTTSHGRHGKRSKRGTTARAGRHGARAKAPLTRFQKIRRWTLRTAIIGMCLTLAVGGVLFGQGYLKLRKVFNGSSSAVALQANIDPTKLKGEGDGRVNILLMGAGGARHSGGDLTDTLMIASIDPVNNQAILFSIPRDLWVKMPNNYIANYQKINAAYESGKYKYLGKQDGTNADRKAIQAGFDAADSTIERVMGVPIHYNALVNFTAFAQAVDTVGGITITAPEQLYDPTMSWDNGRSPILAKAGLNTFDGHHALNYVRSRETSSDFARSQRQRAVLVALKDKVANLGTLANPAKLSSLMSAFGDNVQTDIPLTDMTRMTQIMKKIPSNQIQSIGLADQPNSFVTTGNINGLSVVQPKAGLEDYTAIQGFVRSKLKDGYITQENAKVAVLNGTVTPGLATEKGDELKSYGYNVTRVDNAPTQDYNATTIVDLTAQAGGQSSKKYTLNYLKNRYHVTTVTKTLPQGIVQDGADIVIILAQDASLTAQN